MSLLSTVVAKILTQGIYIIKTMNKLPINRKLSKNSQSNYVNCLSLIYENVILREWKHHIRYGISLNPQNIINAVLFPNGHIQ